MKHFTIKELCSSSTADIKKIDNNPSNEVVKRLTSLVDNVLDPLREWYQAPIFVNSGYRCSKLNKEVRGAYNSQHMRGEAADITTRSKSGNRLLFQYIKESLPFDQLIWEHGGIWIHVSYKEDGNRKQILDI